MEAAAVSDFEFVVACVFLSAVGLLAYTYVVYPLIAICIGSEPHFDICEDLPRVSLLVPAHNEESVIVEKIRNFLSVDYPSGRLELVIANDGSTDATSEVVAPFLCDRIRLVSSDHRRGKANAMNLLAEAAEGELLLFSDANVLMEPEAIRRLADPFQDLNVGAVTGEVRLIGSDAEFGAGESLYYWMERRIQRAESRVGSVMGVDGGMYIVRRSLWVPIPIDTILDDFFVSMSVVRSKRRVVYVSAAKAIESGTPTAKQEFSRRTRITAGAVQLLKRGGVPRFSQPILWFQFTSHKLLRWFSPALFALLLFCNIALMGSSVFFQLTLVIQSCVYGLFVLTMIFPAVRRQPAGGVMFYFGWSQIAMSVGLVRGALDRQPPQWSKGQRLATSAGKTAATTSERDRGVSRSESVSGNGSTN